MDNELTICTVIMAGGLGAARITSGDKIFLLNENESTYIHAGVVYALQNQGTADLKLFRQGKLCSFL
ncbi:hypothetical protein OAD36_04690 [Gammaproteobacteria bacterium]|nr:hypothetical protein [Gammaproteobacteria bacterium]